MPEGYIYLIGGLAALVFTGDLLVRGAVGVAHRMGIPAMVIGLTIVAFGTSAPELMVSIKSSLDGNSGIAIGNIVGSNIANVLLVLGMPALFATTSCGEQGALKSAKFMLFVSVVFAILCLKDLLDFKAAFVLLALLGIFLYESARISRKHKKASAQAAAAEEEGCGMDELDEEAVPKSIWKAVLFVLIGIIGLPLSAKFAIDGAVILARSWGVTDAVIGLTVVAFGTSLPELSTTMMAAIRNHSAVAIGNVIGSNIFNILAIMGITTAITPVPVPEQVVHFDLWVMLGCATLLLYFANHSKNLTRKWGILLTLGYVLYTAIVFQLGQVG
ncbi:calcium/sodium antiporter [Polycladidibacter hongkongensis]|uniref:calcium/sodium antiporter n=1 Tax=Polycladidibacter hongkongensis TaxID=1647556 RepID=UPI0008302A4F|nr:calcium/sodium antiporter [Pseudovibrio hongkongensis]